MENGYRVEAWNFTPLLNINAHNTVKVPDPIEFKGLKTFFNQNDAAQAIESLGPEALVVCLIPYCLDTYPLFRALSKSKARYCTPAASFPFLSRKLGRRFLLSKLSRLSVKRIANRLFNIISYKLLGIKSVSFVLAAGGDRALRNIKMGDDRTEIIKGHSWDYDIYLKLKNSNEPYGETKTAVFLDEYVPFHPDYLHLVNKPPITPEKYYPPLLEFFRFVEYEYGLKVLIAAHPRSIYETHPNYLKGYEVIRGRTAELVKGADLVLLHSSTAVNFAVLFEKPMVFLNYDPNNETIYGSYISHMASHFRKIPVDINRWEDYKRYDFYCVEKELYETYKNRYIKLKDSPELPFWQIFSNRIKQI